MLVWMRGLSPDYPGQVSPETCSQPLTGSEPVMVTFSPGAA
jgi:hypothetical protein